MHMHNLYVLNWGVAVGKIVKNQFRLGNEVFIYVCIQINLYWLQRYCITSITMIDITFYMMLNFY